MKAAYQQKMEAQLKEWAAKIGELMAKTEKAKADLRAGLETVWDDLKSALNNAVARFKKTSSKRPTRRSKQRKRTSSSRRKTTSGKSKKRSMNSVRGSMN